MKQKEISNIIDKASTVGQLETWKFVLTLIDEGNAHLITSIAERSIERLELDKKKYEKTNN